MGCGLSVPDQEPINIGKTERRPRTVTIGQSEKVPANKNIRKDSNGLVASNSSRGATSIVSLEADEDIIDALPKLDPNGHLMPEEVVRRTSLSLSVSKIVVGTKDKGGKELNIDVSSLVLGNPAVDSLLFFNLTIHFLCFVVQYAYRSQRGYYPDGEARMTKNPNTHS